MTALSYPSSAAAYRTTRNTAVLYASELDTILSLNQLTLTWSSERAMMNAIVQQCFKNRLTLDKVKKLNRTDGKRNLKITEVAGRHPPRYINSRQDCRVGGHGAKPQLIWANHMPVASTSPRGAVAAF